ncbi:MAG TPA: hypothetical protein IAB40_04165 [Candidatus Onthocola stercoravium]|nr:hypothetical protein [Candidatus Onthocola stercoravium]
MNSFDNINILNNKRNMDLIESKIKSLNDDISNLNAKISGYENNINNITLFTLLKNEMKNIKNRFKKKEL